MNERTCPEIDINSEIIYETHRGTIKSSLSGTVRWAGMDSNGDYVYGLQLVRLLLCSYKNYSYLQKVKRSGCTDSTFNGFNLFKCDHGYGVITPMRNVRKVICKRITIIMRCR